MERVTSAYANKLLRKLDDDKVFLVDLEMSSSVYVASVDETPVIPDYDYAEVAAKIDEIDEKICRVKHAINVVNSTNMLRIGERMMSIDMMLVRMAQLNRRKSTLNRMRKYQPQTRVNSGLYSSKKPSPEYQYINYDLDIVKKDYERIDAEISEMQLALDKFNQTFEFEIDIDI